MTFVAIGALRADMLRTTKTWWISIFHCLFQSESILALVCRDLGLDPALKYDPFWLDIAAF